MLSVKERFAAKKAQKQQQQTARLLKPPTLSRHQINRANAQKDNVGKMQRLNREAMRDLDGTGEYYTKEEAAAAYQSYLKEWNELVYCRNCFEHRGVFENRTALSLTSDFGTRERAIGRVLANYV